MTRQIPPALLLNADYRPLSYYPLSLLCWQDAVKASFQGKVDVVETYDIALRSTSRSILAPAVVVLKHYWHGGERLAQFTRYNLYLRDHFECQYCGSREELTFDHVIPRSRGGPTDWTNIVAACAACNVRKDRKTPREAGLSLKQAPWRPTVNELMEIGRKFPPPQLFVEWRDYLYWTVALEQE